MKWPLHPTPIPQQEVPFFNLHYLYGSRGEPDPTMVWGTDVDARGLQEYIAACNAAGGVLVSAAHVLVVAVGRALVQFPQLNCRVVGRRIYRFRDVNVRLMIYSRLRHEVDIVLLTRVEQQSVRQVAEWLWQRQLEFARGQSPVERDKRRLRSLPAWLLHLVLVAHRAMHRTFRLPSLGRLDALTSSPVVVNHLGFSGAPPLRMYKPSRFPDESAHLSVTMGAIEPRPVVHAGEVQIQPVAPLFVRADHRLTDACVLGQFVEAVRTLLAHPDRIASPLPRSAGFPSAAA